MRKPHYLVFLTVAVLLPLGQAMAAESQTEQVTGKTVFSFADGAVKFVLVPAEGSNANVTVDFKEMNPNQGGPLSPKTLLTSISESGECITRTGSGKCPVFDATLNSGTLIGPVQVRIFYATNNPFGLNPRVCRFEAAGNGDCTLIGYFPFVPGTFNDPGMIREGPGSLSIWFAVTLAISPTAPGVATILDPVGNDTTMENPYVANPGSNVPLKVELCNALITSMCAPITDAQILVSIVRVDPDFEVILPPDFPGSSTPPPIMEFIEPSGPYQFNWKVPETSGLYTVTFIFLTSNSPTLTAWVQVP